METKNYIVLEIVKEDKTFSFHIPAGASYGTCADSCFEFLGAIAEMQKKAIDAAKPKEEEEV